MKSAQLLLITLVSICPFLSQVTSANCSTLDHQKSQLQTEPILSSSNLVILQNRHEISSKPLHGGVEPAAEGTFEVQTRLAPLAPLASGARHIAGTATNAQQTPGARGQWQQTGV